MNMEKYSYRPQQPNILPPLFNRDEMEVQAFNAVYKKDYRQAIKGVRSFNKSK